MFRGTYLASGIACLGVMAFVIAMNAGPAPAVTSAGVQTRAANVSTTLGGNASVVDLRQSLERIVRRDPSRIESRTFESTSLGRAMQYRVYLPPGYDQDIATRYPVLYLLHGLGGDDRQWLEAGVADTADRMTANDEISPMIIVLPTGEASYWVDHATDGQKWGRYTAVDVVQDVDATFRTIAGRGERGIGGLSMGAHGALQLALNYPETFGAVGSRSLVLRRFGSAPAYFGDAKQYAQRDPMTLAPSKVKTLKATSLWIDIGAGDEWAPLAKQFHAELQQLGVPHVWNVWPGGHGMDYWQAHLSEYLRFYDMSFTGSPVS